MVAQKQITDKKTVPSAEDKARHEKTHKVQKDRLPKTSWQTHSEDAPKSQWNPSALYF